MSNWVKKAPQFGDHIRVKRIAYSHHGIFVSEDEVICYSGEPLKIKDAKVVRQTLNDFLCGGKDEPSAEVEVNTAPALFSPAEVVRRARERLGECNYKITGNNCEHFANWCRRGESRSEQVENAKKVGLAAALGGLLAGGIAAAVAISSDNDSKNA